MKYTVKIANYYENSDNVNADAFSLGYSERTKLSNVLLENNIWLNMPCAGKGRCGKCKIKAYGEISDMSKEEEKLLSKTEIDSGVRLACMTEALGDVVVTLLEREKAQTIQLDSVSSGEIPLKPWCEGYGVAVDIGTTTLAFYLYNLESGALVAKRAAVNPQGIFGADVISRIERALAGESGKLADLIQRSIIKNMSAMCHESGFVSSTDISGVVLTGNTAMLYLLCGYNPASIATAPFEQNHHFGEFVDGGLIGFNSENGLDNAKVYLTRSIAAYVGGDMTTAALASGIVETAKVTLLVDIGTNGELMFKNGERYLSCSTAAGPALEGAGISCGMAAKSGAISRVYLEQDFHGGQRIQYDVIGNAEPSGICGSGIIDLTAVLLDAGVLDETGIIEDSGHNFTDNVIEFGGQPAFKIPDSDIFITQKDIRAIQLSKASICAGILTLIKLGGSREEQVDELLIAGGFGSFINPKSAERIGLIPRGFAEKSHAIGNAAAAGAAIILKNSDYFERSEWLVQRVEALELSTSQVFMDLYIEGMMF